MFSERDLVDSIVVIEDVTASTENSVVCNVTQVRVFGMVVARGHQMSNMRRVEREFKTSAARWLAQKGITHAR